MVRAMHRRCCWPPRQRSARVLQPVLHFFPQAGALQRAVHDLVELDAVAREPVDARPVGHVLVDRLRERIRLLEHHADARAQLHHVLLLVVDVLAVEQDGSFDARARNRVVHAIEAAQERGLAAARRADHGQHLVLGDVDAHLLDGMLLAVIHVDVAAAENRIVDGRCCRRSCRARSAAPAGPGSSGVRPLGFRLRPARSTCAASIFSPPSFESFTKDYRRRVHDHQEGQEHDDGARGLLDEAALGTVGPQEHLHGQRRRRRR